MTSQRERMLAGELYDPNDPELVAARRRARDLLHTLNQSRDADEALRRRLFRELFASGGETAQIEPPFFCDYGENIDLGERVFMNFNCVVLDVCRVKLGSYVFLGPGVQIYTALHPLDAERRRVEEYGAPVEIGDDVWIGGGALVLPGVRIGSRTVVGAGSVVTRDLPDGVLAVGNPCRVVRRIDPRPQLIT